MHDTEDRKHVDGRKTELQDSCENGNEGTVEVVAEYIDKQMTGILPFILLVTKGMTAPRSCY